jgi:hypothetical protein
MSLLPAPFHDDTGLTPRQVVKARRTQASADLAVFRHAVQTRTQAEVDRLDSQAVADASRAAFDEEVDFLDHGLASAGRSAAKTELVARHVERMAAINDRRISRRFGS